MGFFGKKSRTAHQKAQWEKTRLMLRIVAVFFVVFYVIVPFFNMTPDEIEEVGPIFRYIVIVGFIIACVGISVLTLFEYMKNKKAGKYDASAYTDDEGNTDNSDNSESGGDIDDVEDDEDGEDEEDDEEDEDDEDDIDDEGE